MNEEPFTTVEYLDEGIISLRLVVDCFVTFLILLNTRHKISHGGVLRNILVIRTFQFHLLDQTTREEMFSEFRPILE